MLVRCDSDGIANAMQRCDLGCHATELRCAEPVPSNGLATYLAQARSQPDLVLGKSAVIDTDTGDVTVDGTLVRVASDVAMQSGAPDIRVLIVGSLTTKAVTVVGQKSLAIVSGGDIAIDGLFDVSARGNLPGPGAFGDNDCKGKSAPIVEDTHLQGSAGGGGFGSPGGAGGSGDNSASGMGVQVGGAGGATSGNPALVPLRGGCSGGSGRYSKSPGGGGGGAMALVSRTRIAVGAAGTIAANGSAWLGGGGSGGGILLEAPIVEVDANGAVTANGGGGTGCGDQAEDGRTDGKPAQGGDACLEPNRGYVTDGRGGNGGAGNVEATDGAPGLSSPDGSPFGYGGNGGGGVGRIRINTVPGPRQSSGTFSPEPNWAALAVK